MSIVIWFSEIKKREKKNTAERDECDKSRRTIWVFTWAENENVHTEKRGRERKMRRKKRIKIRWRKREKKTNKELGGMDCPWVTQVTLHTQNSLLRRERDVHTHTHTHGYCELLFPPTKTNCQCRMCPCFFGHWLVRMNGQWASTIPIHWTVFQNRRTVFFY